MRSVLATAVLILLSLVSPAAAEEVLLPSRDLIFQPIIIQQTEPLSFDLMDFRADERFEAAHPNNPDIDHHSMFVIKRHVGAALGYDSGVVHGSVGFYLTVAEWGRWNFGVPTAELGLGRYRVFDRKLQQTVVKNEYALIVSVASVHYRMRYFRSLGANAYLNFEQVYDLRHNLSGSQVGVSFSTK